MSTHLLFKDNDDSSAINLDSLEQMLSLYSNNQSDKFHIKQSGIICFKTCEQVMGLLIKIV